MRFKLLCVDITMCHLGAIEANTNRTTSQTEVLEHVKAKQPECHYVTALNMYKTLEDNNHQRALFITISIINIDYNVAAL